MKKRLFLFRLKVGDHPDKAERVYIFKDHCRASAELQAAINNRADPYYFYWVVS